MEPRKINSIIIIKLNGIEFGFDEKQQQQQQTAMIENEWTNESILILDSDSDFFLCWNKFQFTNVNIKKI